MPLLHGSVKIDQDHTTKLNRLHEHIIPHLYKLHPFFCKKSLLNNAF
jgi:hypothetical protein